jgi:hypothetical protein
MIRTHRNAILCWLLAGTVGSITFWLVQKLVEGSTITAFIGKQIVKKGGYPEGLDTLIGWGVHIKVSLGYAAMVALVVLILRPRDSQGRMIASCVIALVLGWMSAIIAPPAISVTISMLAGAGWPDKIWEPNFGFGTAFWNHMQFFLLAWAIQVFAVARMNSAPAATSE